MNLIISSPWWLTSLLLLVLIFAAAEDAVRLRISNLTCAVVVILALAAIGIHGVQLSLWQNVVVSLAILTVGTAAFAAGVFGGGDIKLLAAIGLWLNFSAIPPLAVAIALAGGMLAIVYIGARRLAPVRVISEKRRLKVPYGLAIVAGTLFVFAGQLIHHNSDPVLDRLGVAPPSGG